MLRRVLRQGLLAVLPVHAALEQDVREPVLLLRDLVEGGRLLLRLDEELARVPQGVDFERSARAGELVAWRGTGDQVQVLAAVSYLRGRNEAGGSCRGGFEMGAWTRGFTVSLRSPLARRSLALTQS